MKWMWILTAGLVAAVACSNPPQSHQAEQTDEAEAESSDTVELLFVQNAQGVEFGEGTMTLTGVSPTTLYFSDRPHRIAGQVKVENFLHTMAELGTFLDSPPNAVLVMLEEQGIQNVVLVITERPTLVGDTLSFAIRILAGDPPASASSVSLFIDSAGEPDVWQTPGTVSRDYEQPGTVSRNTEQPGTVARNAPQPGTAPKDARQPSEIETFDYQQPGTYGQSRFDVSGPYDTRGARKEN